MGAERFHLQVQGSTKLLDRTLSDCWVQRSIIWSQSDRALGYPAPLSIQEKQNANKAIAQRDLVLTSDPWKGSLNDSEGYILIYLVLIKSRSLTTRKDPQAVCRPRLTLRDCSTLLDRVVRLSFEHSGLILDSFIQYKVPCNDQVLQIS